MKIKPGAPDSHRGYRIDDDSIIILDVFEKKSQTTPKKVIDNCKRRLKLYDSI